MFRKKKEKKNGEEKMKDINIPDDWTPEQATAVLEFVDAIRDEILTLYQEQIVDYMKDERCYGSEYYVEFEDKDIPF